MMEIFGYVVAGAPFLVAGVGLIVFRWPAVWVGVASLAGAVMAAVLWPGFSGGGIPGAMWEGLGTAGEVVYVLFGGLLLYNVLEAGGAIRTVSVFLGEVASEREALALLVVLGAAPFFESVTGFGVGVVISAPILLAAGFSRLKSAVLASWGQLAVPWGALGVGTLVGAEIAGESFRRLSVASAWVSLPVFVVYALATVALTGGREGLWRRGPEALFYGGVMGVAVLLCSLYAVPELSGVAGGLAVSAVFLGLRARRMGRTRVPVRELAPYGFLLASLAFANGVGPVRDFLGGSFVFEGPGPWLLLSSAFAALLLGVGRRAFTGALGRAAGQWLPVAGTIFAFILAGEVVAESGAAALLAGGAAALLGVAYAAASPLVGALGGFLTGSNTGSNALFMPFQIGAAHGTGGREALVAALQNVAGSQSNMLAPQRVVLAATATGLLGQESKVVRMAAPPVAVSLLVLVAVGVLRVVF